MVLAYSTYLGGNSSDGCYSIAAGSSGNVYLTGTTLSTNFPTKNQYQTEPGDSDSDVFVTKIDTTETGSTSLIYSTYLGGSNTDWGYGIAADSSGNAYLTGYTTSTDFPTKNQYQDDQSLDDAFVTKIDTTETGSSSLIYSTYLGGNGDDRGFGIAVDSSGNVYVAGFTDSTDFPTQNQYQSDETDGDAFVTKLTLEQPSITVTSPNGGEAWDVDSTHDITWTSTGSVGNVKLEYTTDNGSNWTVFDASTLNDGVRPWVVPNTPSTNCLIRISETDGSPSDTSDSVFSIVATTTSTITVTSPNGGESWEVGSTHNITWTSTGTVGNVKLEYTTDNGSNWTVFDASTLNDGVRP